MNGHFFSCDHKSFETLAVKYPSYPIHFLKSNLSSHSSNYCLTCQKEWSSFYPTINCITLSLKILSRFTGKYFKFNDSLLILSIYSNEIVIISLETIDISKYNICELFQTNYNWSSTWFSIEYSYPHVWYKNTVNMLMCVCLYILYVVL